MTCTANFSILGMECHHLNWLSSIIFQRGRAKNHQPDIIYSKPPWLTSDFPLKMGIYPLKVVIFCSRFPGCGPGNAGAASEALGEGWGPGGPGKFPCWIPCWIHVNHRRFHENWHSLRYPLLFPSLSHHYLIISSLWQVIYIYIYNNNPRFVQSHLPSSLIKHLGFLVVE